MHNTPTRPDVNPASALYEKWITALHMFYDELQPGRHQGMAFGAPSWGITTQGFDSDGNPILGCGGMVSDTTYVAPSFRLRADGRFQLGHMWGYYRRNRIAQMTFLGWGYTHSRYNWLVADKGHSINNHWYSQAILTDHERPLSYVNEDLLGIRQWRDPSTWCRLEAGDRDYEKWRIVPASQNVSKEILSEADVASYALRDRVMEERWRRFERIRELRYLKEENRKRVEAGLEPISKRMSAGGPRVYEAGKVLREVEAVDRIAALLDVTKPARRFTPLRKSTEAHKEAQNGNDMVTAHEL